MGVIIIDLSLVFVFGILGNVISLMVYLSPVPTFRTICKKKSADGYQSVPYVVALFSSMLWIYYALLKGGAMLLITINSVGCVIEFVYIALYLLYAPKKAKMATARLLLSLNIVAFGLIVALTMFLTSGPQRVTILGWFCVAFSCSVFAAPLCVIKQVMRTKSVEFMPFSLSFFLTICAVVWFFYGLLLKDICVALPNVLGFVFGILQMILYAIYRNAKPSGLAKHTELPEYVIDVKKLNAITKDTPTDSKVEPGEQIVQVANNL